MSLLPYFPSLTPPIANSIWFEVDIPRDEEAEVSALESEHHLHIMSLTKAASDINPLGKVPNEHTECPDSDDEDEVNSTDSSAEADDDMLHGNDTRNDETETEESFTPNPPNPTPVAPTIGNSVYNEITLDLY